MTDKVGRNAPCPCGSGRKYKQCCALTGTTYVAEDPIGHAGAAQRAVDWLMSRHRKAVGAAFEEGIRGGLTDAERAALDAQDAPTQQAIQRNATEWLLAEGRIAVKGVPRRVAECLLEPDGAHFTTGQRHWIEQMTERPLRMYVVTEIIPGSRMTLHDALDTQAPPVTVSEKSGSDAIRIGTHLGLRIMEVDGRHELSGAFYAFSPAAAEQVVTAMRALIEQRGRHGKDLHRALSSLIRRQWLAQFHANAPAPTEMAT